MNDQAETVHENQQHLIRILLWEFYSVQRQLPTRNYAHGHSFEEWLNDSGGVAVAAMRKPSPSISYVVLVIISVLCMWGVGQAQESTVNLHVSREAILTFNSNIESNLEDLLYLNNGVQVVLVLRESLADRLLHNTYSKADFKELKLEIQRVLGVSDGPRMCTEEQIFQSTNRVLMDYARMPAGKICKEP